MTFVNENLYIKKNAQIAIEIEKKDSREIWTFSEFNYHCHEIFFILRCEMSFPVTTWFIAACAVTTKRIEKRVTKEKKAKNKERMNENKKKKSIRYEMWSLTFSVSSSRTLKKLKSFRQVEFIFYHLFFC